MRAAFGALLLAASFSHAAGAARYGINPDPKSYPQGTPQEALASVLKAVDAGRFDYLVAQLAEPAWVDDRVSRIYGGKFAEQVEETRGHLGPAAVKLLRRFSSEGKWTIDKDEARASLTGSEQGVFFVHKGDRWYLQNRNK